MCVGELVERDIGRLVSRHMAIIFIAPIAGRQIEQTDPIDRFTASVRDVKPLKLLGGTGRLRLMCIGAGETPVDLQPCGRPHVARTFEVGLLRVVKIENKGRQNRRIIIAPAG